VVDGPTDERSPSTAQQPTSIDEVPWDHRWAAELEVLWSLPGWRPDFAADVQQLNDLATGPCMGLDLLALAWRFQAYVRTRERARKRRLPDVKASWWRHCAECPPDRQPVKVRDGQEPDVAWQDRWGDGDASPASDDPSPTEGECVQCGDRPAPRHYCPTCGRAGLEDGEVLMVGGSR
jgi:hypothetical protein